MKVKCCNCGLEQGFNTPAQQPPLNFFRHNNHSYCNACILIITTPKELLPFVGVKR